MLRILSLIALLMLAVGPARAAEGNLPIEVWKSATCDCCGAWVKHLEANGFAVKVNEVEPSALAALKRRAGIGDELASCHTATIAGYVVEGHVPAADIKKLVAKKPEAVGLSVPGMPIGSPGMERGAETEPYDVLLIEKDGDTEVFARY